jgi:large subunit ribosomal protein L3
MIQKDIRFMMLLGKKIGMTQVYDQGGRMTAVTVLQAGPCIVLQSKTPEKDGYLSFQLGFDDKKASRVLKPEEGIAKKANTTAKRFIREWRLKDAKDANYNTGDTMKVELFTDVKYVDIAGISKGKGYQGVMKRHNFGGFGASHGTERKHRAGGSIASHATNRGNSGKPKKGKRMSGHMGAVRVTSRNHKLVSIDPENHLMIIKGSVPGPNGGYVEIHTAKTKK